MVALSPLVEKWGLVLPRRKAPHSGWPFDAQPFGSWARLSRSAMPIGVFGQPSSWAIGRGIAKTNVARNNGLALAGAKAGWPCEARASLSTAPHAAAARDQITGFGAVT